LTPLKHIKLKHEFQLQKQMKEGTRMASAPSTKA